MKHMKWLIPLTVVILVLMIALPAAADDPFGGPPSKTSGNGTTTWAAIYIGGTWDNKCDPAATGVWPNANTFSIETGVVASKEYNCWVTNWSAKTTIPGGGGSRWFKFDTVKSREVEVYVDDDPKWGAAYRYFDPTTCRPSGVGDCDKADGLQRLGIDTNGYWAQRYLAVDDRNDFGVGDRAFANGFWARLYPPEFISRMSYFWPTPNNELLTTRAGSGPRVGDTQGGFGGYSRGNRSVANETGLSYVLLYPADRNKAGDGNTHLLAVKLTGWDGWVYARVFNNMYWDGDVRIGTRFTPSEKYTFPCNNCPYPTNP